MVKYYLYAKDNAQNVATHPFIGEADPHVFMVEEVNSIPEFISSPDTVAQVDEEYIYQVNVNDLNGTETLELGYIIKPYWLDFTDNGNGTGVLSGTAGSRNTGNFQVKLFAYDGIDTTYQEFIIIVSATQVFEPSSKNFGIYPNPVTDHAMIRVNTPVNASLEMRLFNIYGELIRSFEPQELQKGKQLILLDMSDIKPGIYLTKVRIGNIEFVWKVVKAN